MKAAPILLLAAFVLLALAPATAPAQFGKLKDKVEKKIDKKVDEELDKAIDGDPNESQGTTQAAPAAQQHAKGKPGEGVWTNYDFVPGNRVLFAEDFTRDRVGNFPQRIEFLEGNMEIVEWEGRRFLRATSDSRFKVQLPEVLPERFTIEFDFHVPAAHLLSHLFTEEEVGNLNQYPHTWFKIGAHPEIAGPKSSKSRSMKTREGVTAVRIQVDGNYAKMYSDEQRVANLPAADIKRTDHLVMRLLGSEKHPAYIGNLRIAAGGQSLYDAIATDGRAVTHGILFDVDSATLRPESTPTLEEIGTMLEQHADLRLAIHGHTDSQGDDAHNLDLSKRRAESVRQYLIEKYGIAADRLEAKGFGESQPVADNATPEGRQNNRRVELVKLAA